MFKHISRDKNFYKTIFTLSWPVVVQNLVNNSMGFLDTFMVGTLGERYLSGVTLANTIFFVVMLLLFGLQSGSAVLIAQYHGKGDQTAISRVMGIGFSASLIVSTIVALAVTLFPMEVYGFTSHDAELVKIAADYGRIVAFSTVLNAASMIYLSAQRSMENPRIGMTVLIISMALNTFLNWVFIYGKFGMPAMGVEGAALATLLARVVELTIVVIYAMRNKRFKLNFPVMLKPGRVIVHDFIHFSLPVVINETGWGIGFSLYSIIFGHMADATSALAAFAIVRNVDNILSALYFGVGMAASIIVGKELGAGRRAEAKTAGFTLLALSAVIGVIFGIFMFLLSFTVILPYIFPLFGASALTVEIGRWMLICMAVLVPVRAFNFTVIVGVFRGGGDGRMSMIIDLLSMYLVGLPLAAVSGLIFHASPVFVYLMMSIEEIVKLIPAGIRFSQMKWLRNVTR